MERVRCIDAPVENVIFGCKDIVRISRRASKMAYNQNCTLFDSPEAEVAMHPTTFLLVSLVFIWPQETDAAKRALEIVKKAEGTIAFDEEAPGRPVISLNL
jgi:hypothetical protein